ncbi:DUF5076 domain-containing protein [Edaphosphingomonas haloaromaticamans]|uniref:DUF5076 domain-containing protein n=1 Tax=Edaphosphingomonas haloaromaticamans TaxID=653954 RepID=A0A1S1HAB6_9SPHN|nr:DUF5076 domain-containing protein [Sphingomonas haloaromaticamans]OHT18792.1 hypothetical protein BHE75_00769 [Sphingomonas haloaromaticamans]
MDERLIPAAALRDNDAWEPLRVWVAERKLHCSIKVGVYEENGPLPEDAAWGIILADVANHIADALAKEGLRDRDAAIREIFRSFVSELGEPTSETSGDFVS